MDLKNFKLMPFYDLDKKWAVLTIICKKLYGQDLNMDNMSEEIKEKYYSNDPVHKMYIGEVIDIIDRR